MNTHIFPNYIISFRAPSLIGNNHLISTVSEAQLLHENHMDAYVVMYYFLPFQVWEELRIMPRNRIRRAPSFLSC